MWQSFDNQESYLAQLVNDISVLLKKAVVAQGSAGLAVSGGKSPIPLFEQLSQADLPWENIHVTLVDERFVAPDNPDSNEYLARTYLLKNRASRARFTGLITDPANLARCVEHANRQTGSITLALLGMGDDGHTASLFPNAPQLPQALDTSRPQRYLHVSPPAAPYERISMTLAALLQAGQLMLAIAGSHKRAVFEQAARQATPTHPISYLITQTGVPFHAYWHA